MRLKAIVFSLLFIVLISATVPYASAHSPLFPTDNNSLATAFVVTDAAKSWAIYCYYPQSGAVQYFKFDADQGQSLHIMLIVPVAFADNGFNPTVVLMGQGIASADPVPPIEVPQGYGTMVQTGEKPDSADYEPFSPGFYYQFLDIEISAPANGTYYIAVYDLAKAGNYGLPIGDSELFTLEEWIFIPWALVQVYIWEGQSPLLALAPYMIVFVLGFILYTWILNRRKQSLTAFSLAAASSSLVFFGTTFTVLSQMFYSMMFTGIDALMWVTILFAVMPAILGAAAMRIALRPKEKIDRRRRIYMVIIGVLAIFAWAGIYIGPALTIISSALPAGKKPTAESPKPVPLGSGAAAGN